MKIPGITLSCMQLLRTQPVFLGSCHCRISCSHTLIPSPPACPPVNKSASPLPKEHRLWLVLLSPVSLFQCEELAAFGTGSLGKCCPLPSCLLLSIEFSPFSHSIPFFLPGFLKIWSSSYCHFKNWMNFKSSWWRKYGCTAVLFEYSLAVAVGHPFVAKKKKQKSFTSLPFPRALSSKYFGFLNHVYFCK